MSALPEYAAELATIEQYWYFDLLCKDLAPHKLLEKPFSDTEKQLLTEFLLGYTPHEIAQKTHRATGHSIRTARSKYLYPLIKALIQEVTKEQVQPDSPRTLIFPQAF
jgi:hypothetical protein